jgi:hypothetical protein
MMLRKESTWNMTSRNFKTDGISVPQKYFKQHSCLNSKVFSIQADTIKCCATYQQMNNHLLL